MRGTAGLAVLYTVFTIAFSSLWGIEGTAFAAVLSEALYALYLAAVVKFVSPAEMIRLLWKPLASSAVIVGAFLGIGFGSAYAAVPAACVLFVASLLLTGEIARSEIDMIKHVLSPDR
jgi:biotin synthase-like enzyme